MALEHAFGYQRALMLLPGCNMLDQGCRVRISHNVVLVIVAVAPLKWRGRHGLKFVAAAAVALLMMWAEAPLSLYATGSCCSAVCRRAKVGLAAVHFVVEF